MDREDAAARAASRGGARGETGIASAATVLLGGALLNCGIGIGIWRLGVDESMAGPAFFLLGLELACMALTVAIVALALGPRWRGPGEPRRAWWTAALSVVLLVGGVTGVVPRLPLLGVG